MRTDDQPCKSDNTSNSTESTTGQQPGRHADQSSRAGPIADQQEQSSKEDTDIKRWKPWSDHPFLVFLAAVAAVLAILQWFTGKSSLTELLGWDDAQVRSTPVPSTQASIPSTPTLAISAFTTPTLAVPASPSPTLPPLDTQDIALIQKCIEKTENLKAFRFTLDASWDSSVELPGVPSVFGGDAGKPTHIEGSYADDLYHFQGFLGGREVELILDSFFDLNEVYQQTDNGWARVPDTAERKVLLGEDPNALLGLINNGIRAGVDFHNVTLPGEYARHYTFDIDSAKFIPLLPFYKDVPPLISQRLGKGEFWVDPKTGYLLRFKVDVDVAQASYQLELATQQRDQNWDKQAGTPTSTPKAIPTVAYPALLSAEIVLTQHDDLTIQVPDP
ncbi:MAG: hypothetical protein M3437_02480 [Chloroflexota bacterium]|nr:hypothetical protein [Chloroflexota bacterium]MDQ5865694.1 hypothetical protein [Chloroflexota bacterium]